MTKDHIKYITKVLPNNRDHIKPSNVPKETKSILKIQDTLDQKVLQDFLSKNDFDEPLIFGAIPYKNFQDIIPQQFIIDSIDSVQTFSLELYKIVHNIYKENHIQEQKQINSYKQVELRAFRIKVAAFEAK